MKKGRVKITRSDRETDKAVERGGNNAPKTG